MEMEMEMEREADIFVGTEDVGPSSDSGSQPHDRGSVTSSNLILDLVGEVVLTLDSDGLSWQLVPDLEKDPDSLSCLDCKSEVETGIKFSDVYAVELFNWGLIHDSLLPNAGGIFLGHGCEMYRFVVHGFRRSKSRHSLWVLTAYTFGHKDLQTCETWVEQINNSVNMEVGRPKNLLVFIHPLSGKRNGCRTWETVAPIFSRAKVRTEVTVTQRAGHAFDVMASISDRELNSYDGVIAVGGDGFFNEILNGLLSSRHKAPYPPTPTEVIQSVGNVGGFPAKRKFSSGSSNDGGEFLSDPNGTTTDTSHHDDFEPLLTNSEAIALGVSSFSMCHKFFYNPTPSQIGCPNVKYKTTHPDMSSCLSGMAGTGTELHSTDQDPAFSFPNERFRLGIIPAGSTDAIVISTTGARDPVTSALHIVLGKRRCLDVAQVVRWKTSASSTDAPSVRYAASFAGYGFYGDVITESEKYRWMGPKRYDFAGTKVFLKHRSYEAEVAFLDVKSKDPIIDNGLPESGRRRSWRLLRNPKKAVCRVDCVVCRETLKPSQMLKNDASTSHIYSEDSRWLQSKGRFLSVGAAVISCRNEKAPDGLVADAHLSDGFLHLILVKDCPRTFYLWHLTQLTRKGSNPLKFDFVEHHKTPAFTFSSSSDESVWNVDGEIFRACQLSAQVFRGLISLFASGPEV
ncbi:Diacylglycerol kinase [Cinnamomum micranthum f. kanehirae]|uniref:Diacylglycerol kinase n=1 Tax=Cinnamomum micranthum f. kanehirae TaxID=337451 RepID=A0A443PG58_9MAGN|nr:Diacylglycerol kinase [Cinnamomum micranthum f. kanehirae]